MREVPGGEALLPVFYAMLHWLTPSAYRSRSAANNALGLDDVSAVAPNAIRMSIHNKSPDNGVQFPIKVGVNVHRTPWHGTAEVRFSKREKALVIDTKLAAEMWRSHVAVLPSIT